MKLPFNFKLYTLNSSLFTPHSSLLSLHSKILSQISRIFTDCSSSTVLPQGMRFAKANESHRLFYRSFCLSQIAQIIADLFLPQFD